MKNQVLKVLFAFIFFATIFPVVKSADAVVAKGYAVMEQSTRRMLFCENENLRLPMASTTKILTAITAIECCDDLDRIVTVPREAQGVEGSSIYLETGEQLSVRDLLYGLMLQSGNDAAVALSMTVLSGKEEFIKKMNEVARAAGAMNSNFKNPHGLHDPEHYTTCRDLALITAYAMGNPVFKEICATKRVEIPWNHREYNRIILNKNKLLSRFEGANGVKTGYTKAAGRCLVSAAERDGMQLICVTLNCPSMWEDSASLLERGFSQFKMINLCEKGTLRSLPVEGLGKSANVGLKNPICYPLREEEQKHISFEIKTRDCLTAPMKSGEEVGKIQVFLNKQLIFEEKIFTMEEVSYREFFDVLNGIADHWGIK